MPADKKPDGEYYFEDVKNSLDTDFQKESELCDFIEKHIDDFTKDCLGFEYKSHVREYSLSYRRRRNIKGNKRIDFLIITKCGRRIGVECKNPTYTSELSAAVGQCLSYLALFEEQEIPLHNIVILSTKIDHVLPLILNKFNLPIGFICIDKSKHLIFQKSDRR